MNPYRQRIRRIRKIRRVLVHQIESALQSGKDCFVRPQELQRVWPAVADEERENIVRGFAREHGWRVFTSNRVLGAMFVRDSLRSEEAEPRRIRRFRRRVLNLWMRKTGVIVLAVVLAMLVRPLQLPAASCILSNAPDPQGCKPHCCANKSCCAFSKKSGTPVAPPLVKSGGANQQQLIGFVSVRGAASIFVGAALRPAPEIVSVRAHSPPLRATTCIRLI